VDPELYCGTCFHCRIGQTHLCPNGMLIGRDTNGGFADYVSAPVSHVFPLPDSVDSRDAPLIQVLTTCLHAQRQIDIFPGEAVVVFGLGVTGQLHVQLAKPRRVPVIVTRATARARRKLGADFTIPGGGSPERPRAHRWRGADAVIETTGFLPSVASPCTWPGRFCCLAITAKGALPLRPYELALISARVAKSEDPAAIALVEAGRSAGPLVAT
jgi:threonine dehydrogenase-like Zn-dependent dehydrogenase